MMSSVALWLVGWMLQVAQVAPPTWRFRDDTKTVKVVVLAGSIGAYSKSYARVLGSMCTNVEVRNLSQAGLGAFPLKQHFKAQVIENRGLDLDSPDAEHWLVYGGGINSVGTPEATNHHIKNTIVMAHMAGMKVLGLSITPWGDDKDARFRGLEGLKYRRASQKVVDFVMRRLSPVDALGSYVSHRPAKDGPWVSLETPDVSVDVYDSRLRDADATPRDEEVMRRLLMGDNAWKRRHADLDEAQRRDALSADLETLTTLPRWYLRPELRSFDHVHPNAEGHRLIAATICPEVPKSWGCVCETPS